MGDIEIIKLIINGGSFAVLVVIVLWVMFRASPENTATIKSITTDHRNTIESMARGFETTVHTLVREFGIALSTQAQQSRDERIVLSKECREERNQMQARVEAERLLDRQARHNDANKLQEIVAELVVPSTIKKG